MSSCTAQCQTICSVKENYLISVAHMVKTAHTRFPGPQRMKVFRNQRTKVLTLHVGYQLLPKFHTPTRSWKHTDARKRSILHHCPENSRAQFYSSQAIWNFSRASTFTIPRKTSRPYGMVFQLGRRRIRILSCGVMLCNPIIRQDNDMHNRLTDLASTIVTLDLGVEKRVRSKNTQQENGTSL